MMCMGDEVMARAGKLEVRREAEERAGKVGDRVDHDARRGNFEACCERLAVVGGLP